MISISIKLTGANVAGFGVNTQSIFARVQMKQLGDFALQTVKARVARGVGIDDASMPPLSAKTSPIMHRGRFVRQRESYAQWKARHGLQPRRDLYGTGKDGGHMMDNFAVRSSGETSVRISFSSNKARAKGLANERRAPWCSFSDADERAIVEYARQLFHSQVEVIRRQMFTGSARSGRYVNSPLALPAPALAA